MPANKDHIGSSLDELLAADGTLDKVNQIAQESVRAYEEEQARDGGAAVHTSAPPKRIAVVASKVSNAATFTRVGRARAS